LILIVSFNSLKELNTVELYEEKTTLELDFEDGREIIEIEDQKVATAICGKF